MTPPIDWRSIAVRVFRADGACFLLSDAERDALLAADADTPKGGTAAELAAAGYGLLREFNRGPGM